MALRQRVRPEPGQYDYGLYNLIFENSNDGKFNLNKSFGFNSHRSGWGAVMGQLGSLHHESGIVVDSFIEKTFGWMQNLSSEYTAPWVGFIHNPPNIPEWYRDFNKLQYIFQTEPFLKSLKHCKGFYTLSTYLKNWVVDNLPKGYDIPVNSLYHPCAGSDFLPFDYDNWLRNSEQMVLDVGTWLRKQSTLHEVQTGNMRKVKLWPKGHESGTTNRDTMKRFFNHELIHLGKNSFVGGSVVDIEGISNVTYDYLLSRNIVFFDCWDTSANNTLVECIERTTPVMCPNHPVIVEYVGESYPMLYDNSAHASELLRDETNILKAHNYLKTIVESKKLSIDHFIRDLKQSEIYWNI